MEFKRTSEGRVFFTNSPSANMDSQAEQSSKTSLTAADEQDCDQPILRSPLTGRRLDRARPASRDLDDAREAPSQYQVLTLLKALNEKLKLTQIERNSMRQELKAYRQMIGALERQAKDSETALHSLEAQVKKAGVQPAAPETSAQIAETRRLYEKLESRAERHDRTLGELLEQAQAYQKLGTTLSEKQAGFEQFIAQQDKRHLALEGRVEKSETAYEDVTQQVKEALQQEERFVTLLEQDRADRARFMRKLERLEETVLLAQNVAQQALPKGQPVPEVEQDDAPHVEQGYGDHIPHYLLKQQDDAVKVEKHNAWYAPIADKIIVISERLVKVPPSVYLTGAAVILLVGLALNDSRVTSFQWGALFAPSAQQNDEAQLGQLRSADTLYQAPKTLSLKTQNTAPEGVSAPLPDAAQQASMAEQMDTDADAVARALNDIVPGLETVEETAQMDTNAAPTSASAPTPASKDSTQAGDRSAAPSALSASVQALQKQAEDGDARAQHDLAALYVVGKNGVAQDYKQAAFWFDKAAQGGVVNAIYNMGVLYHQGLGVKRDEKTAIDWYRAAAEQGHPEAAYNLGIAYIEGVGVEYDPFQASIHFEKAAQDGIAEAAYNLGLIYENGLLGQPRPAEALMWYKQAADNGVREAEAALNQLVVSLGIDRAEIDQIIDQVRAEKVSLPSSASVPAVPATDSTDLPPKQAPSVPATGQQSSSLTAPSDLLSDGVRFDPTLRQQLLADEQHAELIRAVQSRLMALDLYPGPVDGRVGPMTEDAVRAYQNAYDLPVDGAITQTLLDHMAQI